MKNFAYLVAILTVMFIASVTKAEHNQAVSKMDAASVWDRQGQQINMLFDTTGHVRHAIKHDIKTVVLQPQKF